MISTDFSTGCYVVRIPYPPVELRPNGRPTRWNKAHVTKEYRRACGWAAVEALSGRPRPMIKAANVTICVPTRRRRMDPDNLIASLKAAFDGFQDSGLLANDDRLELAVRYVGAVPKTELRIEISTGPTAAASHDTNQE